MNTIVKCPHCGSDATWHEPSQLYWCNEECPWGIRKEQVS